ncbi:MAG: TIR domain-containing protein [Rhodanobacteraceae bacterium]
MAKTGALQQRVQGVAMRESASDSRFTYRAFISYSHRDKAWGDWLHKALETYRIPSRLVGTQTAAGVIPRRLNPVFRDREELASAIDLGRQVNEALGQSACMVVICSPTSATSRWVNEEVLAYKRMGRGEHIFCLIVDGEPDATDLPGRAAEECFCPALRFRLDADGQPTTERTEPIAADARSDKDGKANARLKLIAGMLGVGFDALKQRDQRRKLQRMAAVAAIAVVVMTITTVLAVYALISRHQAVIAEHAAVVARQAAQRRQKQAERLVDFMLGDLNTKLQQVNRLDIMQAVDDKALAYFQSLPNTDVNPAELVQRAKAQEKIGSVRMELGELPGALAAYRASTRISSRLAAAAPHDIARQVAYSRTLTFIGYVYWDQGKLADAQRAFERGQRVLRTARTRGGNDPSLLFQLYTLDDNIGHVLEARGQLASARTEYRAGLAAMHALVRLKPHDVDDMSVLGSAHNNLGELALERGDLATAIAQNEANNAIQAGLTQRDPKDNGQLEVTLEARAMLGRGLALAGDTRDGINDLQQAVAMAGQLTRLDKRSAEFTEDEALYSAQLARLERLHGDPAKAQALIHRSLTLFAALTKQDPGNAGWQREYAYALLQRAVESHFRHQETAARTRVQSALRILDPMLAKQPGIRRNLLWTLPARLLLAEVSADAQTAQSLREGVLRAIEAQPSGKADPRVLALQVEALLGLGRKAQARPLIGRLWQGGYRDPGFLARLQRARIDYPPNPAFKAELLVASRRDRAVRLPVAHPVHP